MIVTKINPLSVQMGKTTVILGVSERRSPKFSNLAAPMPKRPANAPKAYRSPTNSPSRWDAGKFAQTRLSR